MTRAGWKDFDWQLIRGAALSPELNVALDDALLDAVVAGRRQPTLRLWEWPSSAVVIGRFQ
jgi:lipoate-protein ligase A